MPTLDTHRKTDPGASQEAKTPQADDGQTRTVSPVVSMDFALLDKSLTNPKCGCFFCSLESFVLGM